LLPLLLRGRSFLRAVRSQGPDELRKSRDDISQKFDL
jgi:hypothetical protein